jgi:hypothetical protein
MAFQILLKFCHLCKCYKPRYDIMHSVSNVRLSMHSDQGCQIEDFHTKNPNLGIFWRALEWKMWVHFVDICNI